MTLFRASRGLLSRKSPPKSRSPESGARPPRRGWNADAWAIPLSVAAITFAVFLPALANGFVSWDDDRNFTENLSYRGLGLTQLRWMWTTVHLGHWVPVSWMSLGADYMLWGMNPAGYHLTNVILHCCTAAVVYVMAKRVFRSAFGLSGDDGPTSLAAAFTALVFAVHPLRVESVVWVTERRDVLSGLFMALTVLTYLRSNDPGVNRRRRLALSLVIFIVALLSKATVMTVPAVLLLIDVYPFRRIGGKAGWWNAEARRHYAEKIPFVLLSILFAIISVLALPSRQQLPWSGRLAASAYSLVFYLYKTVIPLRLSPLYPMPSAMDPAAPVFILGYLAAAAFGGVIFYTTRRRPGAATALLAFFILCSPMLGFVQNGPQIAADRYTYHAAPALALLAGAALHVLRTDRRRGTMALATGAFVLAALASLTVRQTRVWHDSATMWAHVVKLQPTSVLARESYGNELLKLGDSGAAREQHEVALAMDTTNAKSLNGLGIAALHEGRIDEAIRYFRRTIVASPTYVDPYVNLGSALGLKGEDSLAIEQYRAALAINPSAPDANFNWGNALYRRGDYPGAVVRYEAALRDRPGDADVLRNLAVAQRRRIGALARRK